MAGEDVRIKSVGGSGYLWRELTLNEGLLLRAVAILAIMVHNYMHWIPESPGENEFGFQADRVARLLDGLWQAPWDAVRLFASYFGHYGVQVFFFLSAYGLTRKHGAGISSWWSFQTRRWRALYPAIILSALGYLLYEGNRIGWSEVWYGKGPNLLMQMVGLSNFIPEKVYSPIGPWWFIGVILQFYLIVPLIWRAVMQWGDKALCLLLVASWVLQVIPGHFLYSKYELNINHTILGHLGVCAMGIWFARRDTLILPWWLLLVSVLLFVGGNFFYVLWIPSGVALLLFLLPLMRLLGEAAARSRVLCALVLPWGQLSLYLFLCNGYLRRPLVDWAKEQAHWWNSMWTCLVFLVIALVWAALLRGLEKSIFLVLRRRHK